MPSVEDRGLDSELLINGDENLKMHISIRKKDGKYVGESIDEPIELDID